MRSNLTNGTLTRVAELITEIWDLLVIIYYLMWDESVNVLCVRLSEKKHLINHFC